MAAALRLPGLLGRREKGGRRGSGGAVGPVSRRVRAARCPLCRFPPAAFLPGVRLWARPGPAELARSLALGAATWRPRVRGEGAGPARPAWALRVCGAAAPCGSRAEPAGLGGVCGQSGTVGDEQARPLNLAGLTAGI